MKSNLPPPPLSYRCSHKLLAPPMHALRLSCKHFTDLVMLAEDRPLTYAENSRRRFHSLVCTVCRRFEKQMESFRALMKATLSEGANPVPDPQFLSDVRSALEAASHQSHPSES